MEFSFGIVLQGDLPDNWIEVSGKLDISESSLHSDPYGGGNQTTGIIEDEIMTNPQDVVDGIKAYIEDKFPILGTTTITSASIAHPSTVSDLQVP